MVKTCSKCGDVLPATNDFFAKRKGSVDGLNCWCKTCCVANANAWYAGLTDAERLSFLERQRDAARLRAPARTELRRENRRVALQHYGGKCACCGEDHPEFLAFDHIQGGGNKHRRETPGANDIGTWLVKNNFPAGFRVLCHNCNMALGFFGYCPHHVAALS